MSRFAPAAAAADLKPSCTPPTLSVGPRSAHSPASIGLTNTSGSLPLLWEKERVSCTTVVSTGSFKVEAPGLPLGFVLLSVNYSQTMTCQKPKETQRVDWQIGSPTLQGLMSFCFMDPSWLLATWLTLASRLHIMH